MKVTSKSFIFQAKLGPLRTRQTEEPFSYISTQPLQNWVCLTDIEVLKVLILLQKLLSAVFIRAQTLPLAIGVNSRMSSESARIGYYLYFYRKTCHSPKKYFNLINCTASIAPWQCFIYTIHCPKHFIWVYTDTALYHPMERLSFLV